MVFESSYTHVLKHNFVRFPGDPQINYLTSPFYSTEFQDKANAALTWNYQKFSTTVYGEYYGNTPNNQATLDVSGYAQPNAGKLGSWVIANWSASYEVLNGLTVTANVNNVFNKQPPFDSTYRGNRQPALQHLQLQQLRPQLLRGRELQVRQVRQTAFAQRGPGASRDPVFFGAAFRDCLRVSRPAAAPAARTGGAGTDRSPAGRRDR